MPISVGDARGQFGAVRQTWRLVPPRESALQMLPAEASARSEVATPRDEGMRAALTEAAPALTGEHLDHEAAKDQGGEGQADYLPRKLLTVGAAPIGDIQVPFPVNVSGVVDLRVKVSLFIDETGRVRRVRFDTPDVAPAFVTAILDTFGSARFKPGELNAVAVKSQLPLEVQFAAAR